MRRALNHTESMNVVPSEPTKTLLHWRWRRQASRINHKTWRHCATREAMWE